MAIGENQLKDLQRKIASIEKDKHRIEGKLESELKALSELVGVCQPDEAEDVAVVLIASLKKKKKKAQKSVEKLFAEIEIQAEKLGLEL